MLVQCALLRWFSMAVLSLVIPLISLPYYMGLIAHRPGGPVASFHPAAANLPQFMTRLAAFKSPLLSQPGLAARWVCYAAGTLGLVALSVAAARRESSG